MRTVLRLILGLIAVGAALLGMTMPLMLPAQAAKDRAYYEQFRSAAAYIVKNGSAPAGDELRKLEDATTGISILSSLVTEPVDCDPSFKKAPSDTLVLSFWRGEWWECYSYPSGRTTLTMSVRAYLLSGVGIELAIYWLVAISCAWGMILLRPRRKAPATKRQLTGHN